MSLARKTQQLFCGSAVSSPSEVIAQFGSLAASSPNFSSDPAVIQSLAAWLNGWASATILTGTPPQPVPALQDFNALFYVLTYQLSYLLDRGIGEWDSGTTYGQYSFCQQGGVIYQSLQNGNLNNTPANPSNIGLWWRTLISSLSGPNLCKAHVSFEGFGSTGTNLSVFSAYNVSSVYKVGTGQYLINFTNPLPADGSGNGLYQLAGSAGTPNGFQSAGGDNNIICGGGPPGTTAIKTANQCQIFNWEPNLNGSGGLEDSNCVSVMFFSA